MRRIVLAVFFASLMSPLAHAASDAPKAPSNPPMAARPAAGTPTGAENCGTPDEFKSCPPLPRRNLPTYPANKR